MAVARVSENMTGIRNDEYKWYQVREAFLDTKTWLLATVHFGASVANGASNVSHSISVDFSRTQRKTRTAAKFWTT